MNLKVIYKNWTKYCEANHECFINPFFPNASLLYPLKTKHFAVFWWFQGVEKRCIGNKWVNMIFVNKFCCHWFFVWFLIQCHIQIVLTSLQELVSTCFILHSKDSISNLYLTHSFPINPFSTSENLRKPYVFLMFSGLEKGFIGNEWVKIKWILTSLAARLQVCWASFVMWPNRGKFKIT